MLICEGKTKRIVQADDPNHVIIETKDDLTGGDAAKKETIRGISYHKTKQTIDVFRLLEKNGIDTSFVQQLDDDRFECHKCEMLPLELVMRRYAWGSFLKREPSLKSTADNPFRFDEIKTEFFHKHAVVVPPLVEEAVQMEEGEARKQFLKDGVWAEGVYTDPLIQIVDGKWLLHSAKIPVDPNKFLIEAPAVVSDEEVSRLIDDIMIPTFKAIEGAWAKIETNNGPVALADMKIEVGRRAVDGKLVVSDVIDNDSWRIWPGSDPRNQLDKQCFREDHALSEVASNYELVASLTSQF